MFNTNLSTLGLFLPITGSIIVLCNIIFGIVWFRKMRRKKIGPSKTSDPSS